MKNLKIKEILRFTQYNDWRNNAQNIVKILSSFSLKRRAVHLNRPFYYSLHHSTKLFNIYFNFLFKARYNLFYLVPAEFPAPAYGRGGEVAVQIVIVKPCRFVAFGIVPLVEQFGVDMFADGAVYKIALAEVPPRARKVVGSLLCASGKNFAV